MSGLKIAMVAGGLFSLVLLGGAGCGIGAVQYSKIGASARFSKYGSFGSDIGEMLDRRYQQRAYVCFGIGGFFSLIGLALIGGSFFVGKKSQPQGQMAWNQPPQQVWQAPPQPPQGWQPPPGQ
jgi:hypothetical protein